MPYVSVAQRDFMEGCRSNPEAMKGKCPPKKVLDEFHRESFRDKVRSAGSAAKAARAGKGRAG
jgi:hypothetical protein